MGSHCIHVTILHHLYRSRSCTLGDFGVKVGKGGTNSILFFEKLNIYEVIVYLTNQVTT